MKILNFGSLNIDYVYSVPHIVRPGETISSGGLEKFAGGKGLNQSVALARAGADVYHAGLAGEDGDFLKTFLRQSGADVSLIERCPGPNGHAVIQVEESGQNSIVLFGGSNRQVTAPFIDRALGRFGPDDLLVLQNEVGMLADIIDKAHSKGIKIALNPSPMNETVLACRLGKVSFFIVNEIEGGALTGKTRPADILEAFAAKYPEAKVALTLGKDGAMYFDGEKTYAHGVYDIPVADTTAAGDTFLGYFLANIFKEEPGEALRLASVAAALAVSVKGASNSIPDARTVRSAELRLKGN